MLVDLQVAVGMDGQVEQAVMRHRTEQVVVEADPGVDAGVTGAVETERDRDLCLLGRPGDRDTSTLAWADLE
jgi:hypothetical protein